MKNFTVYKSQRGSENVSMDVYCYTLLKETAEGVEWRCEKRACHECIVISHDGTCAIKREHNHESNLLDSKRKIVKSSIKEMR